MIVKIVSEDCKDVRNYCEDGDHENPPAFLPLEGEREAVGVSRTMHLCHHHFYLVVFVVIIVAIFVVIIVVVVVVIFVVIFVVSLSLSSTLSS